MGYGYGGTPRRSSSRAFFECFAEVEGVLENCRAESVTVLGRCIERRRGRDAIVTCGSRSEKKEKGLVDLDIGGAAPLLQVVFDMSEWKNSSNENVLPM